MASLWVVVVVLAAVCGYQQGQIATNEQFGQAALEGIGRVEAKLEVISETMVITNAEGGSAYVLSPSTSAERELLIQSLRQQWEHSDGGLHTTGSNN